MDGGWWSIFGNIDGSIEPFTYPEFRTHVERVESEELLATIDKAAGHQQDNTVDQRVDEV